jgi:hypothetical protein
MPVEGRAPACGVLAKERTVQGIGDEPHNPEKIETLQRKLYAKAKAEPDFRFYLLYDKIYRADILGHAYALAKANKGAPGVDGVTFDRIEATGLAEWLSRLGEELRERTYRPQPVRRVLIPKPGGGERPRPCGAWLRHDASRRSRIVWCRRQRSWCWSRSSRSISIPRPTAIGVVLEARLRHGAQCAGRGASGARASQSRILGCRVEDAPPARC